MNKMTPEDYEHLIELLDGRIDELTKPIPSRQILRFAEAIGSVKFGDDDSTATYNDEDYSNLLQAQQLVNELLPPILENLRAKSINPATGWKFEIVTAGHGDYGMCSICQAPYQHFGEAVKVHCIDMRPNAFYGVCRGCVQEYAPIEFVEDNGVEEWLKRNQDICEKLETDHATESRRIHLIDAIRKHAHSTFYFSEIVQNATKWAHRAFGEWR